MAKKTTPPSVRYLRSTEAIRQRCRQLYNKATEGVLEHFRVDVSKISAASEYVIGVMKENYPTFDIPYHSRWRHFYVGDRDLCANLLDRHGDLTEMEIGRLKYELVITSVLLDAGAGPGWSFIDPESSQKLVRSEGLSIASFYAFTDGLYSSNRSTPLMADAVGLQAFTAPLLEKSFQVSADNPLVGVDGRVELIRKLGGLVESNPEVFKIDGLSRLGHIFDYFVRQASSNEGSVSGGRSISALQILEGVLESFSAIWPGRIEVDECNLGDAWKHKDLAGDTDADKIVPFHKLSQWLTYSLIEPLEAIDIEVTEIERMTGLPEYRNGGLLLDLGVIVPQDQEIMKQPLAPDHEAIVEWRALTVILLDTLAADITQKLGKTPEEFPLAKVLQGGTWSAGRKIAAQLRNGGGPPLNIESDGTVF